MKKEEVTSTRTVYSDKCPICKQEIKAFSESNLEYNMKLHKEKCERNNKWRCKDCDWNGDYDELSKDCNANEICPRCPNSNGEVYNEKDFEEMEKEEEEQ